MLPENPVELINIHHSIEEKFNNYFGVDEPIGDIIFYDRTKCPWYLEKDHGLFLHYEESGHMRVRSINRLDIYTKGQYSLIVIDQDGDSCYFLFNKEMRGELICQK